VLVNAFISEFKMFKAEYDQSRDKHDVEISRLLEKFNWK
jgi:hypothetical protein